MPEATPVAPATSGAPAAGAQSSPAAAASAADPIATAVAALKAQNAPPEEQSAPAAAPAVAVEPPKADPPAPGLSVEAASLAKTRGEIRAAQEQLAARERELADKLARLDAFERLQAGFDEDPVGYMRALGSKADPLALSRAFFEAGNEANLTPEQKAFLEVRKKADAAERRVAELERSRQQEQAQAQLANYRASLVAGFAQIDDKTPLVRSMAARRPDVLAAQMVQIAEHVAATEKRVPTAVEMAAMLEPALRAELEPFEGFYEAKFKPAAAAPSPAVVEQVAPPAPTEIPDNERSVAPSTIGLQHSSRTAPPPTLNDDERRKAAARILRAAHAAQA